MLPSKHTNCFANKKDPSWGLFYWQGRMKPTLRLYPDQAYKVLIVKWFFNLFVKARS